MKIADAVLNELALAEKDANGVTLVRQLDRKLYLKVNEALEALGGKWDRRAKRHLFSMDAETAIENAILTGEIVLPKDFDAFYTPAGLAMKLVNMAYGGEPNRPIDPRRRFLEPSAGEGAIVREIVARGGECFSFEIRPAAQRLVSESGVACACVDFLSVRPPPLKGNLYDHVVMNPPFSKRQDIAHVMHAFDFLKPGGRLVSVMSAGVKFRQDKMSVAFRDFVEDHSGTIIDLPEGSFKPATMVNTVVVTMERG